MIDVFATFVGCTRGVTPCFATQDDYDATDAFSPNRLLDSFAMQLVLRTDASPKLPQDPWLAIGPAATAPNLPKLQEQILEANSGPGTAAPFGSGGTPVETPELRRNRISRPPDDPGQPGCGICAHADPGHHRDRQLFATLSLFEFARRAHERSQLGCRVLALSSNS